MTVNRTASKTYQIALFVSALLLASTANAQILGNTNLLLQTLQSALQGIGVAIVTIAIMFVGFRMVFQAAQWKDVAPVFWGGVLIGGATSIAGALGLGG